VGKKPADSRSRIEAPIECPVGIESGDVVASNTVDCRKPAANEDTSVRLDGQGKDTRRQTTPNPRIETGIQRAIGIEPGKIAASSSIDARKLTANHNLSVGLHGHGMYHACNGRRKRRIERPRRLRQSDLPQNQTGHEQPHRRPGKPQPTLRKTTCDGNHHPSPVTHQCTHE